MYSSGADTLNFSTGGTQRMSIASSGDVSVVGNMAVSGTFTGADISGTRISIVSFLAPSTIDTWNVLDANGAIGLTTSPLAMGNDQTSPVIGVKAMPQLWAGGTQLIGFEAATTVSAFGKTVTDSIGFHAKTPTVSMGTLTNAYGLYVDSITGATNNWAVYTADTTPSYFGGEVSVVGNLKIGTQTTRATGTSRGQLAQGSTYIQTTNANVTIDWSKGNIQELASFVCDGAKTITFSNAKDGAAYTLLLTGAVAHSGTCLFAGGTFKASGGNIAPTASKDVLFRFAVINTTIIYNMVDNLQ